MSRLGTLGTKMYRGEATYDFVGKRKFWYAISVLLIIVAMTGLGVRGLFMGVEFQGGAVFTTPPNASLSVEEARQVAQDASGNDARVQELGGNNSLRIQVTGLDTEESDQTQQALAEALGIDTQDIDAEVVGPSWGDQMTSKALQGMIIFLVLVSVYLAIAFEWRMAMAALVALLHDLIITVGVYAIVGFEVTPGTVVGLLTILGYSLYDTVVVFDKVTEKTKNLTKQYRYTYSELANQGLNATLVRSVNTSIVALLPVGGLLFIGTGLLGGGMLKDIALSLFVGLAIGTYSSIFIATPLVTDFRLRDREVRAHDRRMLAKREQPEGPESDEDGPGGGGGPGGGDGGQGPQNGPKITVTRAGAPEGAGVGGSHRQQPVSRNRGRGRPSGKRR
ncbi:protein translocase subunit SecF [Streptomyces sp. ACA25]|uniref:protein translocase subunit SecF n=1 Tax=Streptomyces sp. ACA25 TaxID=3022596 RepID=UPI002307B823|nr:protein translocase subunit SecF [Streptomyces sp. ACA25]MDB1088934.1 protein translocase subunit SecF [Streptomyces sp. ACA25]